LTEPKKPEGSNLADLRARLGIQPGKGASGKPAASGAAPVVSPPPPAAAPPRPAATGSPVAPPVFGTGAPVPPPAMVGLAPPGVAPPPFMQTPAPQQEEERPEEVRRKVWESVVEIPDDAPAEIRPADKFQLGPFLAVLGTVAVSLAVGWMAGGGVFRTVRASRAIRSAGEIHTELLAHQETLRGLKSRIGGAARKGIDATDPAADFEFLDYVEKLRKERPFPAASWVPRHYLYFKEAPTVFEYYRGMQILWDLFDTVGTRYGDPATRAALKAWPQKRAEVLNVLAADGKSGYCLTFHKRDGDVVARLGRYEGERRDNDRTKADIRSLAGGEARTLTEYAPGIETPLSDSPEEWFVRLNPEAIVGDKRLVVTYPGPLLAKDSSAYRDYLFDLNRISLGMQSIAAGQDKLVRALGEISQARRPFTFGF
jgi:hypothetical protein